MVFRNEMENGRQLLESYSYQSLNQPITEVDLNVLLSQAILQQAPITEIESLIQRGADVNIQNRNGFRPLHIAVDINYTECLQLLLATGADTDSIDDTGYTPLLLGASRGKYKSVELLLNHGASINYCDAKNEDNVPEKLQQMGFLTYEPLNVAIENDHPNCVNLLLRRGASANKQYYMGYEINLIPLHHHTCLELLLKHGADPDVFSRNGMTPLMKACKENQIEAVKKLLRHGADVNVANKSCSKYCTALSFAITYGTLTMIELLLQNGANLKKGPDLEYSPLHDAVLADKFDVCRLLLSRGANVHEQSKSGFTALALSAKCHQLKERKHIMEILLQNGSDSNCVTPVKCGLYKSLSPLGEYIRNLKRCRNTNRSELDITIILLFLKYGSRVNIREFQSNGIIDPFGILQYLPEIQDMDIFKLLVSAAKHIDMFSILRSNNLPQGQREYLLIEAAYPRPLKHLVRLAIFEELKSTSIPDCVTKLPLPRILKRYIMFEV